MMPGGYLEEALAISRDFERAWASWLGHFADDVVQNLCGWHPFAQLRTGTDLIE
jgi:hypothetical protein